MKYLRRQNLNSGNVLDNTIVQTADGSVEINPSSGQVTINANLIVSGGIPGPEVSNVMYVTMDGDDANTGKGEGPEQAKRTLKAAVEAAQEGTTIFIRSGEYYEDNPIRLPPKISIIGDNLRRTILRPLNSPKKFTATNVIRSNGIVTITTAETHELKLHDRVRVIIPEANIDIECANITEIVNSNQFSYKDYGVDISLTASIQGIVELGVDFFLVTTQSYIAQLLFKGMQAPGYCINIDKDSIVDTSPYIQNCSNINGPWLRNGTEWLPFQTEQPDLTNTLVKGPRPLRDDEIFPALLSQYGVNTRGAGGGMLIDGDRYNSESPIKSMVADAFTQIAQGAVGFHISNFGYMQLVSCFAVFCDKAFYTTNGGYLSISNSVIDFGNYGFLADGYYPTPYGTGIVNNPYYSTLGSVTVNAEGKGYSTVPNITVEPPDPLIVGGIQAQVTANIDPIRGTINAITVDNQGYGYTFEPQVTINPPFTPYSVWQPSTAYGSGQYVLAGYAEYQVTQGGTSGTDAPTHSAGSLLNGSVEFTFVGAQAVASANLAKNIRVTVNDLSEKPQVASMMFVGDDPVGYYIEATSLSNLAFRYNEQKCRRDVGYIVDAVLSDLIFGTNFRTIYAGRSYLRSYSSKVLSSQRSQTVEGINQARIEVKSRVIPTDLTLEANIDALFDIVVNIVQTGDVGSSIPNFTNLAGRPAGFIEARDILVANKLFFQDQIVDYISNNLQGFQYDEVKCSRDVGIIINAVLDDVILGTNYLTKTAALSYLRNYAGTVLENQQTPTVAGIERARDIVLKILQDELDSEINIKELFDIVTNIIREGNSTVAPATVYIDPIGVNPLIVASARNLETNKESIISSVVDYINNNLDPLSINRYNENLCKRDTGYIVEALVYDLLYSGNSATVNVARSFFDANGSLVIGTQVTEHVSAYTQLKTIIAGIAPGASATTNALIDIIINAINSGQVTIPLPTNPTYVNGSLYQYYNDERTRITNDLSQIRAEVIEYLNTVFSGNFNYNEVTCRRDIGYIIDALAYDITYGGNTQISNAALSYSEGSVIAGEIEETKKAYQYWKSIIPLVLQNQAVPNAVGGQVTILPVGSPVPSLYPSTNIQNLLQIVINVIDYGPGYVPEPVTESDFDLGISGLVIFKELILNDLVTIQDNVINYLNSTYGGNVDVTVFPGIIDIPAGTVVKFHNVSTISTGGTALEYVGSGVTYNALPFFGGEPNPANEKTETNNGKCFTVTNDQVGNFRVGNLFNVNALTGGVTIDANNLSLGGISSIGPFKRNGIPVGVELKEVSNNASLISSIGTQDVNTAPTQLAVATYVENRYLNKVQADTAQTVESDVIFVKDVAINGGDLTSSALTFNLLDSTVTTVNAFGSATNIDVGASTGTLTINNRQTVFNSTDSIQIPTGNVAQRDSTPVAGQIRYNSQLSTFEGFGPGNQWGSLGGVRDVDGNTYIIPETAPGANENILYFYNDGFLTATLERTSFNLSAGVVVNINGVTGSDSTTNGALVVDGGVGIAQNLNVGGTATVTGDVSVNGGDLITTQTTFNLLNTTATTVNAFGAATLIEIGSAIGTTNINNNLDVDGDIHLDGGDLTSSTSTFNLLNTTVNNLNIGNAASALIMGAATGTATIRNASVVLNGDLEVQGGDLTTNQTTFNLLNATATAVNAFGAATTLSIGATTGTLTVNNQQTVFNSTDSIQIPVGTTSQRDATPALGQIRYNSQLSSFEGYGPGNAWGSLGGVKDVDGNTYIIPETSAGSNENILYFYNNGVLTLTLEQTSFNLSAGVVANINDTTNSTSTTSGALVVDGGVGIASNLYVGGNEVITGNLEVQDTITTPNANSIAIGTPELGILDGAVEMVTTTSLTDGVAQLNQILTLLVPLPPVNFPNAQNLTVSGVSQRIMFTAAGSQALNGTGITTPAAGTVVYVNRANSLATTSITATGPGTRGTLTVNRNSVPAVTKALTYGNTTQVITTTITGTTLGSNIVTFVQPSVGVLFPGYLIRLAAAGAFGGLTNNAYYYITAVTSSTLALSNYNAVTGTIGAAFSGTSTASGSATFTSVSDNGTFTSNNTSLIVANNTAYPPATPGFHEIVDLNVTGTSVPAGWNTVQVVHSQAGSTTVGTNTSNTGIWYYDNSPTVAPTFSAQTFALNTTGLTYSSTIPHYNSSTVYDIGFNLTWNAGQTGHPSTASNVLTTAAVGPWASAGNKSYTALGYTTLPASTTVTSGSGPNTTTFRTSIIAGFGAWTTTTTVPQITADNSYTTAASALPALNSIILYKTGTTSSVSFLDESNIFFNAAVGGSTAGATRCVNPDAGTAAQDTPVFTAGSALFNSQTGALFNTDATVVGTGTGVNSLKHDVTNYSTGYLPAGPNLSIRTAANAQYFTFRFTRTGVGKFGIVYTTSTGVAAIYCAMPGTGGISGTTSTLNKWLDLRIDNSLANGCALGGNMNPASTGTLTYNCSFGTLSSTNATNNEIWVRIRLNQGQSITSLYLRDSTV